MKAMKMAAAIIVAAIAQQATAMDFAPAGAQLAPIGWAAVDSSYAAAARQVELSYPGTTPGDAGYSPEEFAATVESGLKERLEARLEQALTTAEAESTRSVSTN